MVSAPTAISTKRTQPFPEKPRDERGRVVSLESLALQSVDSKDLEGKDWAVSQKRELMRASARLCAMALPRTIERWLVRERVMQVHLERGLQLFGLGKHAGKNVLVLCVDSTRVEKLAGRAPVVTCDVQPSPITLTPPTAT